MSFPEIENKTPFAATPLYLTDEEARPLLIVITRASLEFDGAGRFYVAEQQMGVKPAGIFYGEPGASPYKYEPDTAFCKLATDVILLGSACATEPETTCVDVGLQVGSLQKVARVFGNRYWETSSGNARMTAPEPFERIPLHYGLAFGGWDRTHADPALHSFETRNPLGRGYCAQAAVLKDGTPVPNIEDPRNLIADPHDCPAPLGFGFTSPDWQPRAQYAGTYDAAWARDRAPSLPVDFDRRFFSAASAGLVADGYLHGDEQVLVRGVSPYGDVSFTLPGIGEIRHRVRLRGQLPRDLTTQLDTIVIDTDESSVHLTWRASIVVPRGAQDVLELEIALNP